METLEVTPDASTRWSDDPPPAIEEQEFDLLAFELWSHATFVDLAASEEWPEREEEVAGRASCL